MYPLLINSSHTSEEQTYQDEKLLRNLSKKELRFITGDSSTRFDVRFLGGDSATTTGFAGRFRIDLIRESK